MASLYNKIMKCFRNFSDSCPSGNAYCENKNKVVSGAFEFSRGSLNIAINRGNCDTLVKQGRFFNNKCIG